MRDLPAHKLQLQRAIKIAARLKFAEDEEADYTPRRAAIGSGIGSLAGLLGGAAWGAYDPGAYAALDENGKPTLKRHNRVYGAIRTALRGGALGGLGGAAIGGLATDLLQNPTKLPKPPIAPAPKIVPAALALS